MPQVSIIVPHLGETDLFEQTLVSVLGNRPNDCEILVPQSNYDDPYELSGEVTFIKVGRSASIASRFQAAVESSDSSVIHLLTPGVEVTEGWCEWSVAHFQDPYVGCVTPIVVDENDRIISCGLTADLFLRKKLMSAGKKSDPDRLRKLNPIGPSSVAAYYRRSALEQIGNIADFGASTFDLEIALSLEAIGFDSKLEVDSRINCKEELLQVSALQAGLEMQKTIWRFAGADGIARSLLLFAGVNLLELSSALFQPTNLMRFAGRMVALKDVLRLSNYGQSLRSLNGPELPGYKLDRSNEILNIESNQKADTIEPNRSTRRAA